MPRNLLAGLFCLCGILVILIGLLGIFKKTKDPKTGKTTTTAPAAPLLLGIGGILMCVAALVYFLAKTDRKFTKQSRTYAQVRGAGTLFDAATMPFR